MVINSNNVAEKTASNLAVSNGALSSSLFRLSSGSKIVNPSDDAAASRSVPGLIRVKESTPHSIISGTRFHLRRRRTDSSNRQQGHYPHGGTQSASAGCDEINKDRELYDKEFQQLKDFVLNLETKEFNEVPLFSDDDIKVTIDSTGTEFTLPAITCIADNYWPQFLC